MSTPDPLALSSASLLLVLLAAASLLLTVVSHACVYLRLATRRRAPAVTPPISVLKPLKGSDDELYANLCSLAEQDYPGPFEIVLGAAEPDDPALTVAQRLRRAYPEVCIRVVPGRQGPGLNPKVANLEAFARAARHPYLLVSDSNVRVGPRYLRDTAAPLADPRVGLVTNVLAGIGERSLGAALENIHLNGFIAGAVCAADLLVHHPCVVGKSMLMPRAALERVGGFESVRDVLGEDYLLGVAMKRAGYRVVLSPRVIGTVNRRWSVGRFMARHLRWSQMRRWIAPTAYLFEPLLNPVPWLLAIASAALAGGMGEAAGTWLALALGMVGLKVASDVALGLRLRGERPRGISPLLVPLKDVIVLGIWLVAWVHRSVQWRGNRMRIGPGSALYPPRRRARSAEVAVVTAAPVDEAA